MLINNFILLSCVRINDDDDDDDVVLEHTHASMSDFSHRKSLACFTTESLNSPPVAATKNWSRLQ